MSTNPATDIVCFGCGNEFQRGVRISRQEAGGYVSLCQSCIRERAGVAERPPEPGWHHRPVCAGLWVAIPPEGTALSVRARY